MDTKLIFGGVEGGATGTKVVLVGSDGKLLSSASGPASNPWLVGMDQAVDVYYNLVSEAKQSAGLPADTKLVSLGLSLSGCDSESGAKLIATSLLAKHPTLTDHCLVVNDTLGPLAAVSDHGGVALISGTGSISVLVNPDGTSHRCGGWGHMLGDEGSAYWISHYCMKKYVDHVENLNKCPHSVDLVTHLIFEHFEITDKSGLLPFLYTDFKKPRIASLCKSLAVAATEHKDPLCCEAFEHAAFLLARQVIALVPNADKSLLNQAGGLNILCIGSVWKSWPLLQQGFIRGLQTSDVKLSEVTLYQLTSVTAAAVGAAFLGARQAGTHLPVDYAANSAVLYHYVASQ